MDSASVRVTVLGLVAVLLASGLGVAASPSARSPGAPGGTLPVSVLVARAPSSSAQSPAPLSNGPSASGFRPDSSGWGYVSGNISGVPWPQGIAFDPQNGLLYVTNWAPNNLSLVNPVSKAVVGTIGVGQAPFGVALDPTNGHLYVVDDYSNNITVVNTSTFHTIGSIPTGVGPWSIVLDSVNGDFYVPNTSGANNTTVIDPRTGLQVASITVGYDSTDVAFDPANDRIFVTNAQSDNVSVINPTSNKAIRSLAVGNWPEGIAYDPGNGDLYVANTVADNVSVINASTYASVATIPVGAGPGDVAFDPATGYVYVTDQFSDNLTVIDPAVQTSVASLTMGDSPDPVEFDSANGNLYVGNVLSGNLSIVSSGTPPARLLSVNVSPASDSLYVGSSVALYATPTCSVSSCPPGVTYTWHLTNDLGSINSTVGANVLFTAGSTVGSLEVYLNATLNGTTVEAPPVAITITATPPVPTLSRVIVSPGSANLTPGEIQWFGATPLCVGGLCPNNVTFAWRLTNNLGSLSASSGNLTKFTAGSSAGNDSLAVTGELNGTMVTSSSVAIAVRNGSTAPPPVVTLVAVVVDPASESVDAGATVALTAVPICSNASCPAGVSVSWSLNRSDGSISPSAGLTANFTAGTTGGPVTIEATATLTGHSVAEFATITIESAPSPTPTPAAATFLGFTGSTGYLVLLGTIALVAVAIAALVIFGRRRTPKKPS